MAYQLVGTFTISWVGDGVGPFTAAVPASPRLQVGAGGNFGGGTLAGGPVLVPGGDSPTTGNVSTACTTMATNLAAALNAQIAQIQGWSTGTTQ